MYTSSLVSESLRLILLVTYAGTLSIMMFENMLKVCSGHTAIFNNLDLQMCHFYKFCYFSDHV